MRATYWEHSGFSVADGRTTLLFDYIGGGFEKPEGATVAFISHEHGDHASDKVYALADTVVRGMADGEERDLDGVHVRAYGSTDEGVSFLVKIGEKTVFHAGDLNYWHWKHESTPEEIETALRDYERVLATLEDEQIDLAFFPVDPRMGDGYQEGAEMFLHRIKPGLMIPMHWWKRAEIARQFAQTHEAVHALTAPGESVEF